MAEKKTKRKKDRRNYLKIAKKKKVKEAVIILAGFEEAGEKGKELSERIMSFVKRKNIKIHLFI